MWTKRITMRVLAGMALVGGLAGTAKAQVKAEDILARRPVQLVPVTMPAGAELAACRAEQVAWPKPEKGPAPTGVVVKDSQGRLVRQFIDTNGGTRHNIFSYYLNGVECYRETDQNGNGKPDQFRWLGPNGGKWGADADEDGRIDTWYLLAPEELSQELLAALQSKDAKRLEAMLPTDAELKSLGLPEAESAKIRQRAAGAVKRMQETADALRLTDKAKWIHLEVGLPHVTPADSFGGRDDVVKHRSTTVLVDLGDGKVASFQTGEILLIGRAWKVIDGPAPGGAAIGGGNGTDVVGIDVPPEAQAWVQKLGALQPPANPADHPKYSANRAAILEEIVKVTQGAQQEPWLKQMIDAYAGAAEGGEPAALQRLKQWMERIDATAPKSAVAAYTSFRILSAENTLKSQKITKESEMQEVQKWWREQLEAFIAKHPTAEDTPEAMNRLAWAYEYAKDGEEQAKRWYERLGREFSSHPYGVRAPGAVKRLTSEGQPFALAGQTLDGKAFNAAQLTGKVTLVYYWASWGTGTAGELKQFAELAKALGPKGLEIVTVNLDDEPAKAVTMLNAAQLPGTHLYAAGGLDKSPLAAAYGIQMIPHLFVVGKDGKVTNRNAQPGSMLKDEVEKLLK